jgi:hypothetical protein
LLHSLGKKAEGRMKAEISTFSPHPSALYRQFFVDVKSQDANVIVLQLRAGQWGVVGRLKGLWVWKWG